MAELVVKDVALRLGDNEILKGVSLAVPAGEVVALARPLRQRQDHAVARRRGAGDTASRLDCHRRSRFFDAARGIDLPAEERGLGLVFQSYALWPHRTVFDNVAYGLKLRGVSAADTKTRVDKTLSQIGLGHLGARYPHQLSGGQQQRVAIARALVYEPPVILLDEPLSNLDAKLREEARAWLRTLIVTLGLSAIHVTHDQVEAMAIADRDRACSMPAYRAGRPSDRALQRAGNVVRGRIHGQQQPAGRQACRNSGGRATFEVLGERLNGIARTKAAAGEKATGIIRIERVRCASSPGPNRLKMQLKAPMYLGERWELVFARENITVRAYASAPLEPGEHYVEFPSEALWVF